MQSNKAIIKRILHYLKPYSFFLLCSVLAAAVSALLSLYLPVLTGNAVDLLLGQGEVDFKALLNILLRMGVVIGVSALG